MASSDQTPQAQYDIIPEKHKVPLHSSPSPPPPSTPQSSSMLQADNVLYAGAGEAAEMRHKTLTMSNAETYHKNKHRAEGSPEVHFDSKDEDHTCRTCALLLWGGVVSAMVVVALAGAALALAILFTGLVNICSQCDSTTGEAVGQSCGQCRGSHSTYFSWVLLLEYHLTWLAVIKLDLGESTTFKDVGQVYLISKSTD